LATEGTGNWIGFAEGIVCVTIPDRDCQITDVIIDVMVEEPALNTDEWDVIVEGSITIRGEALLVQELFYTEPRARIPLAPGTYAVRGLIGDLDRLDDPVSPAQERHRIQIWPGERPRRVIKRFPL
jgi:hypothetical protein